jgi:hypothetical protein
MIAIMRKQEQMLISSVGCSLNERESGGILGHYERRVNKSYSPVCGLMLNQNSTDSSTNTHKSNNNIFSYNNTPFTPSSVPKKHKKEMNNPEDSDRVLLLLK